VSDMIATAAGNETLPQPEGFKYPKPPFPNTHPLVNQKNHQKLFDYIRPRLAQGISVRDNQVNRFAQIDKDVAGWMRMSEEDRKRLRKHQATGIPQATLTSLPLTYVQLDDLSTYYTQTFSPGKSMFYHTGKPDETKASDQIVLLMNNHAIYAGYYNQLFQSIWAMLKYNLGGLFGGWEEDYGPKFQVDDQTNQVGVTDEVVWAGNKIHALDMYNTVFDPSVHPSLLYKDGEWAARISMKSHYWLAKMALAGKYYNCEDALRNDNGMQTCKYYRYPPEEAHFSSDESTTSNWISRLSDSPKHFQTTGFEITEVFIRLNPAQFGLVSGKDADARNHYEIWRITLLNDQQIIEATFMNNVHNHIPFYFGLINDDGMQRHQKSIAEILNPLQNLASHIMNIHIQATRKKLFGLTVYDKTMVDLSQIPEGEVAARIPALASAAGKDLRNSIWQADNSNLDTENAMQALDQVMRIVNQFFPTQALPSQIAGIDRAVNSQVAAVQQGANRRQQKSAILLDNTCLRPMRFGLFYNILQYQADGQDITDFRGRPVTINLQELRETDLPFIIGMGLKAIDRAAIADRLQQVIFALIQNPQAAQRINVLKLIDYWTDMMDIDVDMTQFEIQPAEVAANAQAADGAAVGTGVQPATNPQAVTEPIYG
jgi:hypothetical protein